jgi:microcompartment protein CcmK/EutM
MKASHGCLTGRSTSPWLAGVGRGFPAVVTVAGGQSMRQAYTAAGIDPDGNIVGIPETF